MPVTHSLEFRRYRAIIEKTLAQLTPEMINHIPCSNGNSIGMLIRHLSGNIKSRFSDFHSSDGEKPWRQREREFEEKAYSQDEIQQLWQEAWQILEAELDALEEADLNNMVQIRGINLSIAEALQRSLAHLAYHAGQIVLLARMATETDWQWISIPKGQSEQYNANPTREKGFGDE